MNFFKNLSPHIKENIASFSISGCIIVLFYILFTHLPVIGKGISAVWSALAPFIYGGALAFLLVPFRKLVEYRWLKNVSIKKSTKRGIAVTLSLLLLIAIIIAFFWLLIPQLTSSIRTFISAFSSYIDAIQKFIDDLGQAGGSTGKAIADSLNDLVADAGDTIRNRLIGANGGLEKLLTIGYDVIRQVLNFFIGVIISVYLLKDEEKFKVGFKKFTYGLLPEQGANFIHYLWCLNRDAFNNFIFGKAIDSLIIGILCYICVAIMQLPYPVLIAVVVGVTNMIPVFGPFIGAIPCLIILVIIDPWAALKFLIFIIILQQIDGNIIGPAILGNSLGLPTLWIMFAIIVGGALFGVLGMFIGVPVFSVIYVLIRDRIAVRLEKRNISFEQYDQ